MVLVLLLHRLTVVESALGFCSTAHILTSHAAEGLVALAHIQNVTVRCLNLLLRLCDGLQVLILLDYLLQFKLTIVLAEGELGERSIRRR